MATFHTVAYLPSVSFKKPATNATGPLWLTVYVMAVAASAFGFSVRQLPWWYQFLVALTPMLSVLGLWLCHLSDPGIIPPAAERDCIVELLSDGNLDGVPNPNLYKRDGVHGTWMRLANQGTPFEGYEKYCNTCNIWRPQRGHHCNDCGHCMRRFDHHCDVVGNCIALKNHRWFVLFLVSAQVGCGLMLGGALWRLQLKDFPSSKSFDQYETYVLLIMALVYGYHVILLLFGTAHCLALALDVTTKDLMTETDLVKNLPCRIWGRRSLTHLWRYWKVACCAAVEWRGNAVQPLLGADCA